MNRIGILSLAFLLLTVSFQNCGKIESLKIGQAALGSGSEGGIGGEDIPPPPFSGACLALNPKRLNHDEAIPAALCNRGSTLPTTITVAINATTTFTCLGSNGSNQSGCQVNRCSNTQRVVNNICENCPSGQTSIGGVCMPAGVAGKCLIPKNMLLNNDENLPAALCNPGSPTPTFSSVAVGTTTTYDCVGTAGGATETNCSIRRCAINEIKVGSLCTPCPSGQNGINGVCAAPGSGGTGSTTGNLFIAPSNATEFYIDFGKDVAYDQGTALATAKRIERATGNEKNVLLTFERNPNGSFTSTSVIELLKEFTFEGDNYKNYFHIHSLKNNKFLNCQVINDDPLEQVLQVYAYNPITNQVGEEPEFEASAICYKNGKFYGSLDGGFLSAYFFDLNRINFASDLYLGADTVLSDGAQASFHFPTTTTYLPTFRVTNNYLVMKRTDPSVVQPDLDDRIQFYPFVNNRLANVSSPGLIQCRASMNPQASESCKIRYYNNNGNYAFVAYGVYNSSNVLIRQSEIIYTVAFSGTPAVFSTTIHGNSVGYRTGETGRPKFDELGPYDFLFVEPEIFIGKNGFMGAPNVSSPGYVDTFLYNSTTVRYPYTNTFIRTDLTDADRFGFIDGDGTTFIISAPGNGTSTRPGRIYFY
jgi:hypothetical protein